MYRSLKLLTHKEMVGVLIGLGMLCTGVVIAIASYANHEFKTHTCAAIF